MGLPRDSDVEMAAKILAAVPEMVSRDFSGNPKPFWLMAEVHLLQGSK